MFVNPSIYNGLGRFNNNYDLTALARQSASSAASRLSGINYTNSLTQQINQLSLKRVSEFDSNFKSDLTALHQAAKNLSDKNSSVYASRAAETSSDAFTAVADSGATITKGAVEISQIAKAKSFTSESKASTSTVDSSFGGDLTIASGEKEIKIDFSAKEGETVAESYSRLSKEINAKQTEVKASVEVDKETGYASLKLQSSKTGTDNDFTVSGTLSDSLKLNQNVSQAQNMKYSYNGVSGESQSNTVNLDNGKLHLTAKTATSGIATVNVKESGSSLTDGLKAFAKAYNQFIDHQKSTDNPMTQAVMKQFQNTVSSSLDKLDIDGLSYDKDTGKIDVDEDKLNTSAAKNADSIKKTLGRFDSMASNISRKTEQVLDRPTNTYLPDYSTHNYPIKAFMYNYNSSSTLNNLNQMTNSSTILDFRI